MEVQAKGKQFDSIQLMRGIAALSVVFAHITMFGSGVFGVDLFFLISGFIMTHVTRYGTKHFLVKRVIRIVPLYWLMTLATAALLILMPQYFRTTVFSTAGLIKSLLFIPMNEIGPSGDVANSLLGVGWTLILEVFFYIIFFICASVNNKHRVAIATSVLCFLVLLGLIFYDSENLFISFFAQPIMLEFALGMLLYKLLCESRFANHSLKTKAGRIVCLCAAAIIWAAMFSFDYIPFIYDMSRILKFGLPSFAVFILIFKGTEGLKIPKPFLMLGDISFSLYLTHSFVVQGFSRLIYNIDYFSLKGLILVFIAVIPAVIITAFISWYIIENKFTGFLKKKLIK